MSQIRHKSKYTLIYGLVMSNVSINQSIDNNCTLWNHLNSNSKRTLTNKFVGKVYIQTVFYFNFDFDITLLRISCI